MIQMDINASYSEPVDISDIFNINSTSLSFKILKEFKDIQV